MRAWIAAALLLLGASQARAECAWVLWSQTVVTASTPMNVQWTPDAAYGSKAGCEAKAREEHERVKQEHRDFEKKVDEWKRVRGRLLVFV